MATDAEKKLAYAVAWLREGHRTRAAVQQLLAEYDRLKTIERRLEETTTWCGEYGMHRAVEYIRTGETGRALLGSATPTPPATRPEFSTNDDRICANTIAEALTQRYGAVKFSLRQWAARQAMDVCEAWTVEADAREAAFTDDRPTDAEFDAFRAAIASGRGSGDPLPGHEVTCPACGATIRARMADDAATFERDQKVTHNGRPARVLIAGTIHVFIAYEDVPQHGAAITLWVKADELTPAQPASPRCDSDDINECSCNSTTTEPTEEA